MKKILRWCGGFLAAMLVTVSPGISHTALAEEAASAQAETEIRNGWLDENLGPGVARWVDENGNIAEQPGRPAEDQTGSGQESETDQAGGGQEPEAAQTSNGQEAAADTASVSQDSASSEAESGRQIDPAKPMVALTFDDGPYAPVGNQIMDCLAQYGGKATFFVVGNRVSAYQTEIRRMAEEGHEIGNHTYEHKYLTKLSAEQAQRQINLTGDAVQNAAGIRPALVRPPGGYQNKTVAALANAPLIMWSIDTRDWKTRNTENTVNAVLSQIKDGDIVLMHELYPQTGAAALEIIPRLTEAGYQLVTVSEMAALRGGAAAGGVYYRFRP